MRLTWLRFRLDWGLPARATSPRFFAEPLALLQTPTAINFSRRPGSAGSRVSEIRDRRCDWSLTFGVAPLRGGNLDTFCEASETPEVDIFSLSYSLQRTGGKIGAHGTDCWSRTIQQPVVRRGYRRPWPPRRRSLLWRKRPYDFPANTVDTRWARWRSAIWMLRCNCWRTGRSTLQERAGRQSH